MNPLIATSVPLDGCHLIEASAGCGKTHSITTLFVRLVLERRLEVAQILVVTYTRAATAELRDRIRRRLRDALDRLSEADAGPTDPADELGIYLAGRTAERAADERRLQAALRDFDQAAILTIHAFGQRVLSDQAFETHSPFETGFIEDVLPLVDDVTRDYWARRYYTASLMELEAAQAHGANPADLTDLGRRVHGAPELRVVPEVAAPEVDEAALVEAWHAARDAAHAEWARDTEAATRFLKSGVLNGSKYKPANIERWCRQMDEAGAAEPPNLAQCVGKFATSALRDGLNKGHDKQLAERPCFAACERWLEAHEALMGYLQARTLASRRELVSYVQREVALRKQRMGVMGFDDLLSSLKAALAGPAGRDLIDGVRASYRAALVDEFQDTDPVQYSIFRALFAAPDSTLFLIGDPKQAIYAFRGADVFAYLDAARGIAQARWGLNRNYRSDPGLLKVLEGLYARLTDPFLHPGIEFTPPQPRPGAQDALKLNGSPLPPFEVLLAEPGADDKPVTKRRAERFIPGVIAAEIRALLDSGATLRLDGERNEPVEARHVAVLCRTNRQAASMQDALRAVGIPSVLEGDSSVFDTPLCEELERVLRAVAQPGDGRKVRAALATILFGVDTTALRRMHDGADTAWDGWLASFAEWNRVWRERGFIQALHRMLDERRVQQILLARPDGQRQLTNLLHLGELLHTAATRGHLGPLALLHWLSQMRTDEERRGGLVGESEQVRLESDEHAVRLTTIHKSKGLEYPIVYCPFLWTGPFAGPKKYSLFHDTDEPGAALTLDLGSEQLKQHKAWQDAEELTESLRVLYVALTRARHRCSIVWGRFAGSDESPLAHLLHAERDAAQPTEFRGDAVAARSSQTSKRVKDLGSAGLRGALQALAREIPGLSLRSFALTPVQPVGPRVATDSAVLPLELRPRVLDRRLPRHHRVSSFSALTAGVEHGVGALAGEGLDHDERAEDAAALVQRDVVPASAGEPVRLHDFPRGARAGNLIHHVYEHLDFQASRPDIDAQVATSLGRFGYTGDMAELHASLSAAIADSLATPLRADEPDLMLARVPTGDRIAELEFLFPVAESAEARLLTAGALASVFEAFDAPAASPGYASSLRKLPFAALSGYLKGYVDLVFRHRGRYFVVDYKSNHLGDRPSDYAPARLAQAMGESHYYLQYHLYAVALHRHLRQRLGARYEPAQHFGGVLYLFVRGMSPSHAPGTGVFADRPSPELLEALSTALSQPRGNP